MSLAGAAMIVQAAGAVHQSIGAFYGARSQKLTLKAQASALEYQQRMANLNQRIVAREAVDAYQQAQKMIGQVTMQRGQEQAQARASMAARGLQAGVGSAAEVMASMEYAKQYESMAMSAQAVRQRASMMTQRTDIANQAMMAGVQAGALRGAAGAIMPGQALIGSLLGSAGNMMSQWAYAQQFATQQQQGMAPLVSTPGTGNSGRSLRAGG